MRTPTPPADGWRERKKRLTRDELQRTAIEMFRARGYEDVTVEEIAAAAAVSPRTFYRYFPAKEDLVLGSLDELTDGIVTALAARPPDEPVLDSVRAAAIEVARAVAGDHERNRAVNEILMATPVLQQRGAERRPHVEAALVPFVAGRLGLDPDQDLIPALVAGCTIEACRAAITHWSTHGSRGEVAEHIDRALQALAVGFDRTIEARRTVGAPTA